MTLSLSLGFLFPSFALALSVGPDNFGYFSIDSLSFGGPTYEFQDISGTGTRLTFFDADNLAVQEADDGVAPNIPLTTLNIGQGFRFYGAFYSAVHMSSNGFLTFTLDGDADSISNQCALPNSINPDNIIAAVWDDLVLANPPSNVSGGYYQAFAACPYSSLGASGACVVFQWNNADHFGGGADSFDFQVVLHENNNILMNFGPGNPEAGSGSTTGVENDAGSDGLTHVCNSAASLPASHSVLFTPNGVRLTLNKTVAIDTGVENCSADDQVVITPGQSVRYCYTVLNTGALPIVSHTLVDDNEGAILTDFPYNLAPQSSAFITQVAVINSSVTGSANWTGKNGTLSGIAFDTATVIVDADGDGKPDEGDECPLDPAKIIPGQCGCGVAETDSDSDAVFDCVDQCPSNSAKSLPGVCGCGSLDLDFNLNGVIDCQSTTDLRAELNKLADQVGKLKAKSARRQTVKPKAVKQLLQAVTNQIKQTALTLQVLAGFNLSVLSTNMEKAVKKALKNGSPSFGKNKKAARKAISSFLLGLNP